MARLRLVKIYLMITIMFSYITINSEIKAKQRQISILKALGMSHLQLEKMLAFTAIKRTVLGLFIGSILSVCLCLAFSFSTLPVELLLLLPYWDIAIGIICVFVLVILASTFSAKSAVKNFKTKRCFDDN